MYSLEDYNKVDTCNHFVKKQYFSKDLWIYSLGLILITHFSSPLQKDIIVHFTSFVSLRFFQTSLRSFMP